VLSGSIPCSHTTQNDQLPTCHLVSHTRRSLYAEEHTAACAAVVVTVVVVNVVLVMATFVVWSEQLVTDRLTLVSCTRRATDSIDKRFCFDVIVQDR